MSITKEEEQMITILSQDKDIKNLKKDKLKLERKLELFNKKKDKCKDYHSKIIKKDKVIHKLKDGIKKDFLNFGENMLPKSYIRISKRFPHLTLQEIIDLEKKVQENGGSIQVHSGDFILTKRETNSNSSYPGYQFYISWTCCHSYVNTNGPNGGCNPPRRLYINIKKPHYHCGGDVKLYQRDLERYTLVIKSPPINPGACNLTKPYPAGKCDMPETFYLLEEDEKKQDVSQVKVSDVTTSISYNIDVLEKTIEEYSNEILKMKELKTNIELLLS